MYNSCESCGNMPYQYDRDCMFMCPIVREQYLMNENMRNKCRQCSSTHRNYHENTYEYYPYTYPREEEYYSFNNKVRMRKVAIEEIID